MSPAQILERVIQRIPHPRLINSIDLTKGDSVRFSWRGTQFRVGPQLNVEEVQGGLLASTAQAILLQALLTIS
ncbi:MAG: hypothetical protein JWO82_1664 [Akkermansiaceae bacterium]|nr:hypothetical protein [Akkermansiaceae bacterium]